ncbi:ruBisCO large subunit-binding protein subunit beta, chloroplastic-like [Silene latifolia]|uniref:ruBisCO large subunit-binding protein subunit beta, chloroplastic-like n=1 Tax=Silene latifolia TaxID=37657 RepID=UPI003D779E30
MEDALNATKLMKRRITRDMKHMSAAFPFTNFCGHRRRRRSWWWMCLLRLSLKVDEIKEQLENEEQKIGAEIFRHALPYPIRKIAENAGANVRLVVEKVLGNDDFRYGYNAATGSYEDLMESGIMDPTKVHWHSANMTSGCRSLSFPFSLTIFHHRK